MPLSPSCSVPSSPAHAIRTALIHSLHHAHRPELADLVASADLDLDFPGLWLRPQDAFNSVSTAWLEQRLLAASVEGGLPVEWIHVLSGGRGREV